MRHLVFAFLLLAAAVEAGPPSSPPRAEIEGLAASDPCAAARRIAEQGPCLRAEDCGAFQDWRRLFGVPRTLPLDPELVRGRSGRVRIDDPGSVRVSETPAPFPCPATERGGAAPGP